MPNISVIAKFLLWNSVSTAGKYSTMTVHVQQKDRAQ